MEHEEDWDGIDRRLHHRRVYNDEIIVKEHKPAINPSVYIPILFTMIMGIAGYILSMHDSITKSDFQIQKLNESCNEIKEHVKSLEKRFDDTDKHLNSIELSLIDMLHTKKIP